MSKEQSTIIKGIAIMMMLWFHLFLHPDMENLFQPLLRIDNIPIEYFIAQASYPVSFFLILSGYGLTYVYHHKGLNAREQIRRVAKIYINYWVILAIYVSLAAFVRPGFIKLDILHVFANLTAFYCTWNGEVWFLFPYTMLSISAAFIVKTIYSMKDRKRLFTILSTYIIVFLALKMIPLPENKYMQTCYMQLIYYVQLLFYFSLGVLLYILYQHKEAIRQSIHISTKLSQTSSICLFLLIVFIKSLFKITIADGIYAFLFIVLFNCIELNKHLKAFLLVMGKYSMQMWMIHTIICVYLFHDFIYSFKYPVIIYIVLLTLSFLSAYCVSRLVRIFHL